MNESRVGGNGPSSADFDEVCAQFDPQLRQLKILLTTYYPDLPLPAWLSGSE
ncbi:MAG: hypothetical protein ACR2P6_06325 [Gammaproteobacteria bacterium]